jgi:hypothetical protein
MGGEYPDARIMATPGTFCEAIVTRKRGRATLKKAPADRPGVTNTGLASRSRKSPR